MCILLVFVTYVCWCVNVLVKVTATLTYLVLSEILQDSCEQELCTITKIYLLSLGQIQRTTSFCLTERTFDNEPTKKYTIFSVNNSPWLFYLLFSTTLPNVVLNNK
jgi:hypothetical protein